jgi:hypothetical protein
MNKSILEQDYIEPTRPYSQKELRYNRNKLLRALKVGKIRASHSKCNHFYNVKEYGRKEQEIKDNGTNDVGNCSVCWKYNKTPRYLRDRVDNLIHSYTSNFYKPQDILSYEKLDIELSYYKWLYDEFN